MTASSRGSGRRVFREDRVGLERELVVGQVARPEGQRAFDVVDGLLDRLIRKRPHQVQVEALEARRLDRFDRAFCLVAGMDPAQHFQLGVVESLDA